MIWFSVSKEYGTHSLLVCWIALRNLSARIVQHGGADDEDVVIERRRGHPLL
jgi:hypothetical protein